MTLRPWTFGTTLETLAVDIPEGRAWEPTELALDEMLNLGREVQAELSLVPVDDRLQVLQRLGEMWSLRSHDGELERIVTNMATATKYPKEDILLDVGMVPQVLSAHSLRENLDLSLPGGVGSADRFTPFGPRGEIINVPSGPVMIIASGNSLVPAVIPTAIALALANLTVVKPSLINYDAFIEVFSPLEELARHDRAAELMARALKIIYLGHGGPRFRYLLEKGKLGVVNYWGGGAGRAAVMAMTSVNPYHPRCFYNGPLTGMAIISSARADEHAARGLASNMVVYEQQLCSSPTIGAFVGTMDEALAFGEKTAKALNDILSRREVVEDADLQFVRSSGLRVMELVGSRIIRSPDYRVPWDMAFSPGASNLDAAVGSFPAFGLHARRRFIELVVMDDVPSAAALLTSVPKMTSFQGVDGVQTVGLALSAQEMVEAKAALVNEGIFRMVSLEDMYYRDPAEPYDGQPLATLFSYPLYHRPRVVPR